ncbi:TetR/AcrR family transcriptional regulator [Enterobacillus tribolii]|uniref:TetR family transcriptional regulator n=1 Tax=Enterobacillus tribolii TaxID=1487935 RepID=A0A370QTT1_9GAMM|nr:TetR/AcrR family transcriptional regulator [Enterobacillus tribolii]MBW7981269.1 TetR/AcrR family transcriptional regulator [Enterobacillus tribolii]RDK92667.1 TetR family transcriptional regulator [Enterobacillus tribolii]
MTNDTPQHKKKNPARLHEQLLEAASIIAARSGIASLSLNAVAQEAGVSKGGLLHHFPGKQALIHALYERLLATMEKNILALMSLDPEPYGRFTRTYLIYLAGLNGTDESRQLAVLSLAMPDENVLRKCWRDWMLKHLANGDELDNSPTGTLVRYAADGLWLSELTEGPTLPPQHRQALVDRLCAMTYRQADKMAE